jgi:hypothetical protein
MKREELVEVRKATLARLERLRRVGDHSAEAPDVRANAEDILRLQDHLLERMR